MTYCLRCREQGVESTVTRGEMSQTLIGSIRQKVNENMWVFQGSNTYTTEESCDRGHKWKEYSKQGQVKVMFEPNLIVIAPAVAEAK